MVLSQGVENKTDLQSLKMKKHSAELKKKNCIFIKYPETETRLCRTQLRGSSGQDTSQILEGKFDNKTAQGRP